MAVEAPEKTMVTNYDDDEDDEKPLVFRRSNTGSKQNTANSEVKKPSSSQASNGQNSIAQKSKAVVPPAKSPPAKSPIGSPKASNLSAKASTVKSPVPNSKPSTSSNDQAKKLVTQNANSTIKVETKTVKNTNDSSVKSPMANSKASVSSSDQSKNPVKQNLATAVKKENESIKKENNDDDSDDDKPLSGKYKVNFKATVKSQPEDSDDEVPLSAKYQVKSSAGTSGNNEKKPLASKVQQNGSSAKDSQLKSSKRPLDNKGKALDQSSGKKPKLSGTDAQKGDDRISIAQRTKNPSSSNSKSPPTKAKSKVVSSSSKKISKNSKKITKNSKYSKSTKALPSAGDGQKKWTTLVHSGVIFPPPYKPHGVKILYKGQPVDLTPELEEVATMYAVMKDTDYMQKSQFVENFWTDWRKLLGKNHIIQNLKDCDFTPIYEWHQSEKEKKKQMSTEEKKAIREEKLKQEEKYMWAIVDGVKEKVGNFRVEPPGLFRGRGEHPKMGKLKRRIRPSDITINIGKDAPIPECPIPGESWKEIKHDDTVTWLAFWNDPINPREFKYVFLAASSSLKGQSDKEKYEKARTLKKYIKNIRTAYTKDFTNKDVMKRQIAVATYLIDKLALRAGNEKDDDEADTVGCCTLKVGNVECVPPNMLKFDFLGKDSIQYVNTVDVEAPVYKAIGQFQAGKKKSDDLFDELDTTKLNAHLKGLMPGLTAKVFRTYNASITLDDMLSRETKDGEVAEKVVVYQHANKEVAIICNHQRAVSRSHSAQMSKLTEKIQEVKDLVKELKTDLDRARKGKPPLKDSEGKQKRNLSTEALEKKIAQSNAKIEKMERDMHTKEDLKTVALGTSKINYLDPRITVAWCKRHEVPIEKIFNKSLLAKFAWAMDVEPAFRF
ncbi:hypothetical protein ACFE04_022867 [Oxalis oulophora]